jgi:hypothetical protein
MTRPVRFDQCATCHEDVHRGSFKQDCVACHTERTFKSAPFDHAAATAFPLDGGHAKLECVKCHTNASPPLLSVAASPLTPRIIDFKGASRECVSCHGDSDPHKGNFGRLCNACHRTATFDVKDFRHSRAPEFFAGQHQPVRCEQCHIKGAALPALRGTPARAAVAAQPAARPASAVTVRIAQQVSPPAAMPSMACVSCHSDVHLGQAGIECERCHTVEGAKFAVVGFSHDRSRFPLTGKHADVMCAQCHRTETETFPAGRGTAMVLHPRGVGECQACHKDPHLGQVSTQCETCHQTSTFTLATFTHRGLDDFFGGIHSRYKCVDCHKKETGTFPAGSGTAVRYLVGRTCAACHRGF